METSSRLIDVIKMCAVEHLAQFLDASVYVHGSCLSDHHPSDVDIAIVYSEIEVNPAVAWDRFQPFLRCVASRVCTPLHTSVINRVEQSRSYFPDRVAALLVWPPKAETA